MAFLHWSTAAPSGGGCARWLRRELVSEICPRHGTADLLADHRKAPCVLQALVRVPRCDPKRPPVASIIPTAPGDFATP